MSVLGGVETTDKTPGPSKTAGQGLFDDDDDDEDDLFSTTKTDKTETKKGRGHPK